MTGLIARHAAERTFHDAQARERAATFAADPGRLRVEDDAFLTHAGWIRPAFAALGDLRGQDALDYGCGHGVAAVVMARRGARVSAFDLSPGYVREANIRARANDVTLDAVVAAGEELPFADESFDVVWGNAILHHLELPRALPELKRVLRPGARAVFCEPWGGNPLLELARRRLPYPGKERTRDERPLLPADLATIRGQFPSCRATGHELFAALGRVHPRLRALARLDRVVVGMVPKSQMWGRYLVIELRRE